MIADLRDLSRLRMGGIYGGTAFQRWPPQRVRL